MGSNARTGSTPVAGTRIFGGKSLFEAVFRYSYVVTKICTNLYKPYFMGFCDAFTFFQLDKMFRTFAEVKYIKILL